MFSILAENYSIYLPLALGAYISFNVLNVPDLSIESAYLMGGLIAWKISLITPLDPYLLFFAGLVAACFSGALIGALSSFITRFCAIAQVLSGIIVIGLVHGVAYFISQGAHHTISGGTMGVPLVTLVASLFFVLTVLFLRTQIGYTVSIFGINASFFKYHKISDWFVYSVGLAVSNGLAGVSGFLVARNHGFVDLGMAQGIPLMGLCILTIGSLFAPKSTFKMPLIPVVGTFGYLLLQHFILRLGVTSFYFTIAESSIVLMGLALTRSRRKVS